MWIQLKEFKDYYYFNELGQVRSKNGKLLKPNKGGYKLTLVKGGTKKVSESYIRSLFRDTDIWRAVEIENVKKGM